MPNDGVSDVDMSQAVRTPNLRYYTIFTPCTWEAHRNVDPPIVDAKDSAKLK